MDQISRLPAPRPMQRDQNALEKTVALDRPANGLRRQRCVMQIHWTYVRHE
jgi:hypothetical protein